MILVDTSVVVDFLRGRSTTQTETSRHAILTTDVAVGDLVLCEVLQGVPNEHNAREIEDWLHRLYIVPVVDEWVAVEAARHYRMLRGFGITVRKTIDMLIAARCIRDDLALLHNDRDFIVIAAHLPLREVPTAS